MKSTLIAAALMAISFTAHAEHGFGHGGWVAPAIIGGILGYDLNQSRSVQPPQYQQPPQTIYYEPQYREPIPVYREEWVYDPVCRCDVKIMRQIGWR
jgi:hypothetical protein